jgi:hypothetical protein
MVILEVGIEIIGVFHHIITGTIGTKYLMKNEAD